MSSKTKKQLECLICRILRISKVRLTYGHCKLTKNKNKLLPIDVNKCGGLCRGEIVSVSQDREIRIDCGILIDIDNEEELNNNYIVGEYVEVSGTYQIYFPNTESGR